MLFLVTLFASKLLAQVNNISGIMLHKANIWSKGFTQSTWLSMGFHFWWLIRREQSLFSETFHCESFNVIINNLKVFYFHDSLRHIHIGPLTYGVLKTVSNLKADLNVVSNPEFFMLFRSYVYCWKYQRICHFLLT